MYDNVSIYDNIFNLGCQIYFLSESRITRILRGFLLVRGVGCLNQDNPPNHLISGTGFWDGILLMSGQSSELGFMRL